MGLIQELKKAGKRFNFDFDTSGLTAYTDQNSDTLFRRMVTEGRTLSLIRIQEGVKGTAALKLLNDSITYQAANDCSMTADGNSTVFTDRDIVTVKHGFLKTFCQDDLSGFWTVLATRAGAMEENEELIFEDVLMEYILELHMDALESLIWTGDSSGADLIDGFATTMDADAVIPNANSTGITALSASNAYDEFVRVARLLPAAVRRRGQAKIFCGQEYFDFLRDDLFSQNLYHVSVANEEVQSLVLPATGITVEQVPGLDGHNGIYAGRSQDFIFGTALESDAGSVEMWYDKTDDLIYVRNKFYAGVQYPFSNQIVKWTPAAS